METRMTDAQRFISRTAAEIDWNAKHLGSPDVSGSCAKCNGPIHDYYRMLDGRGRTIVMPQNERFEVCESCGCMRLVNEDGAK